MSDILQLLSKPWIGSALGIVGILAAIVFYTRSRRISRLSFQKDEVAIIGGSGAAFPEEVQITFGDARVDRVTATRYVVWNSGNTTLSGTQIVDADPLRLELESSNKVLKAEILRASRSVNAVTLRAHDTRVSTVDIGFDYLDPNDGFTLEVIHSGPKFDLHLCGTLRGLPDGVTNCGRSAWYFDRRLRQMPFPFGMSMKLVIWTSLVFGCLVTVIGLMTPLLLHWFPSLAERRASEPASMRWPILFAGVTYIILPVLLLWLKRRRYPACLEPSLDEGNTEQDDRPNVDSASASSS